MSEAVYILCALTSLVCAVLLVRAYRRNGVPLLFWSALCFLALSLENVVLFLDVFIFPEVNLTVPRRLVALGGLSLLLYGLIWKTK